MKKLIVFAAILVVVGILCTFFFTNKNKEPEVDPNEKPWTVGDVTEISSEVSTEQTVFDDAVMCFSNFINTELRNKYSFLSESSVYMADDFIALVIGLYVYDTDSDGVEELSVIYVDDGAFSVDIYEFVDGEAKVSASTKLALDPMDEKLFSVENLSSSNIAARMTIYPNSNERLYALTCELADNETGYNAYTAVYSYKDDEITLKNSYRLRSHENKLTFIDTVSSTPLYSVIGSFTEDTTDTTDVTDTTAVTDAIEEETEVDVTVESDYDSLADAFNEHFAKIGLTSPDISANGSALSKYKVTPVDSEQKIFEFTGSNGEVMFSENGFLQSFILDV